jgi:luciferase family oxidoreductase group 1
MASKNPAFSILDLASVTAGKTPADAFKNVLDLAQHAESWGYTRYWLAEHHNMPGIASAATSVLIGYVAAGTSTLRVGSGGVMLPNHAPLVIAEQFGTLESLYPGRIDLGLGRAPGTDPATSYALRRGLQTDARDFPELVAELQKYLGPPRPEDRVRAYPGSNSNVPIWLLGSSTYSARLAAQLGLPFAFASHFAPDEILDAIAVYRGYFKPSSNLAKPYVMIGVPVVVAETDEEAKRLSTTAKQKFLDLIRGNPLLAKPPVETMDGLWSPAERDAVMSRLAMAVIGAPDTVKQHIAKLIQLTEADEIMAVSNIYHHEDQLRSYELFANIMKESSKTEKTPSVALAEAS